MKTRLLVVVLLLSLLLESATSDSERPKDRRRGNRQREGRRPQNPEQHPVADSLVRADRRGQDDGDRSQRLGNNGGHVGNKDGGVDRAAQQDDITRLMRMLNGVWDNSAQVSFEEEVESPVRHPPTNAVFHPVRVTLRKGSDDDDNQGHYMQHTITTPREPFTEQRLFVYAQPRRGVLASVYAFREPDRWLDAWRDISRFEDLSMEDLVPQSMCQELFRRDGDDGFVVNGFVRPCMIRRNSTMRELDIYLKVAESNVLLNFQQLDLQGDLVQGLPTPFNMTKIADSPIATPDYASIKQALRKGHDVAYKLELSRCMRPPDVGSHSDNDHLHSRRPLTLIGHVINEFQFIPGGPPRNMPYVRSTASQMMVPFGDEFPRHTHLTQLFLFEDNMIFLMPYERPLNRSQQGHQDTYICGLESGYRGGPSFSVRELSGLRQLGSSDSVRAALQAGYRLKLVADMSTCNSTVPSSLMTTGGTTIDSHQLLEDGTVVFSSKSTSTSICGPGMMISGVHGHLKDQEVAMHQWGLQMADWSDCFTSYNTCPVSPSPGEPGIVFLRV